MQRGKLGSDLGRNCYAGERDMRASWSYGRGSGDPATGRNHVWPCVAEEC